MSPGHRGEKEASVPDDAVSDMQQGGETVLPQESSSSDAVPEGELIEAPDVVQGGLLDDFVPDAHVVVDPPAIPVFEIEDATQAATFSETHPENAQDFVPLSELRKAKKNRRKEMCILGLHHNQKINMLKKKHLTHRLCRLSWNIQLIQM
ncbi:unnamed protein product [Rhodiola kirilowii]